MNGLQYFRRKRGLTQAGLGNRVGQQQSTISHLERGALKPSDELLAKLADALGVSPAYVLLQPVVIHETVEFPDPDQAVSL